MVLKEEGYELELGTGLEAAQKVFEEEKNND